MMNQVDKKKKELEEEAEKEREKIVKSKIIEIEETFKIEK